MELTRYGYSLGNRWPVLRLSLACRIPNVDPGPIKIFFLLQKAGTTGGIGLIYYLAAGRLSLLATIFNTCRNLTKSSIWITTSTSSSSVQLHAKRQWIFHNQGLSQHKFTQNWSLTNWLTYQKPPKYRLNFFQTSAKYKYFLFVLLLNSISALQCMVKYNSVQFITWEIVWGPWAASAWQRGRGSGAGGAGGEGTVQHCTALHCTALHCTVLYYIVRHKDCTAKKAALHWTIMNWRPTYSYLKWSKL